MSNVPTWSTTAGNNNSSPPNGWPEGMARSAVNDAAREMMAALAKWYQDCNSSLVTTGGTLAYALTTNTVYTALSQIPLLAFRINAANTGAVTLAVDGLTAKSVVKGGSALSSGDLPINALVVVAYNPNLDRFEIIGPPKASEIASGTLMLFQQTAAPTGWTKQTTHNDKALRVVSGTASSGGSTAFSSVFAARTIAQANLPNVNFSHSLSVGTSISNGTNVITDGSASTVTGGGAVDVRRDTNVENLSLASGAVSGTVSSGGSGTAMDFAVQYVDLIIASKN